MNAKTVYVAQFTSCVSGHWVDAAHEPFDTIDEATTWVDQCMSGSVTRVLRRTVTDEVIYTAPKVYLRPLEACCPKCGEPFLPADEDNLEHIETVNGERCGGIGVIVA